MGQSLFDAAAKKIQNYRKGGFGVGGVDDMPWIGVGLGVLQQLVIHLLNLWIMFVLPPVEFSYPPTGVWAFLQSVQTFFLLFCGDMQEKTHQQIAIVA